MKLWKKLLPVATVGATALAVTPMLTGCANKGIVDLSKYEAKFTRLSHTGEMSLNDAGKAYFEHAQAAELLKDDLLVYLSAQTAMLKQYITVLGKWIWLLDLDNLGELKVTQAKLDNIQVKPVAGTNEAKVSGEIYLKLVAEILDDETATEVIGEYTLETTHKLSDVTYRLISGTYVPPETNKDEYHFEAKMSNRIKLEKDTDWGITRSYNGKAVYTKGVKAGKTESAQNTTNWSCDALPDIIEVKILEQTVQLDPLNILDYYSNYLWDVQCPNPGK